MAEKFSLRESVERQINRVLARGSRFEAFDQVRQRHFWSSHFFLAGAGYMIPAGGYDLFISTPGQIGQGYPVPLTTRETNWLGSGRVPDQQNFVIHEIGVTLKRPPAAPQLVVVGEGGALVNVPGAPFWNAPSNSIAANVAPGGVNGLAPIHPQDSQAILYGGVLEMGFLTNKVPIGLLADFSQSSGMYGMGTTPYAVGLSTLMNALTGPLPSEEPSDIPNMPGVPAGDSVNGIPAAAFRRKLEVPILLQKSEQMSMRINFPRPVQLMPSFEAENPLGGTGWFEIRVDWWATESFAELS